MARSLADFIVIERWTARAVAKRDRQTVRTEFLRASKFLAIAARAETVPTSANLDWDGTQGTLLLVGAGERARP